jgi:ribosome biogenesis GTPase / thiamine phosphate phosphatase
VTPFLRALGWTSQQTTLLEGIALSADSTVGRIVGQHRREWDVAMEDGTERASLAGKRWSGSVDHALHVQPVAGDWVAVRRPVENGALVIEQILPRTTTLERGQAGRNGQGQVVVANVNWVAVVVACVEAGTSEHTEHRSLNPRRIERYLTAIDAGGASPVVVLNKADLAPAPAELRAKMAERLGGIPVVLASAVSPTGLSELAGLFAAGQTIGFVGLSGVGKSSLINAMIERLALRTAEARVKDGRGRHTTTHRELVATESGVLLIDTPGMREFSLGQATVADLDAFTDIAVRSIDCRFRDCGHGEEPGCAVREAVLRGELALDRVRHYRDLWVEIREGERLQREKNGPRRPRTSR